MTHRSRLYFTAATTPLLFPPDPTRFGDRADGGGGKPVPGSKPPHHQVPLGEVLRGWGPLTPFRVKPRAAGPSRPPPQCWRDPRCTNTRVQRSHPTRTNHPSTHQGEGSPWGGTMAIICPMRTEPGSTKDNQRCSTERSSSTEGQEPHTPDGSKLLQPLPATGCRILQWGRRSGRTPRVRVRCASSLPW